MVRIVDQSLNKLPGALLPWYEKNKRELLWRQDKDPYHIWLSEIMLQQTRVEAVKGYYARFLAVLPTIESLANANDELLYKLWEGLGYYSRVRNLKKAANIIMQAHDGHFPTDHKAVLALPGIGDYTAGAICSIAFGQKTPAVDGNVLRVVSRLQADFSPIDSPARKKEVQLLLADIYPDDAGNFTQALMELGATVCGPNKAPDCANCPCKDFCLGYQQGVAEELPVKTPKKGRRIEEKTVFLLRCGEKLAVRKRPETGLLADLWEFPNVPGKMTAQEALEQASQWGCCPRELHKSIGKTHIFTHIQWNMTGYYIQLRHQHPDYQWFGKDTPALPTAFRQFLG
jgi:A/G-specific adenine glycosylase